MEKALAQSKANHPSKKQNHKIFKPLFSDKSMRLDYAISAAEELGERLSKSKEKLCIEDIMLFGSTVRGEENPRDLDMLMIHSSPELERFQIEYQDREVKDTEKLIALVQMLHGKVDLFKVLAGTKAMSLIEQGLFNLGYMGTEFFTSPRYRGQWNARNRKIHGFDDEVINFASNIFNEGMLFNWETGRYDTPAKEKYNPSKL